MRHELSPDIVAMLKQRHLADLARTRAMWSTPWQQSTKVEHFEANPHPRHRFGKALLAALATWLFGCVAIGTVARAVEDACEAEPISSWMGALK